MSNKLDLFLILEFLDKRNLRLYESIRDEPELESELRNNLGWLIPQWFTTSTNDNDHRDLIFLFDMLCSDKWSNLNQHPELKTKLLACSGLGKKTKHKFFKPNGKKTKHVPLIEHLSVIYPDIKSSSVQLWCRKNTLEEFIETMESLGLTDDEIDAIKPEYLRYRKTQA